MSLLGPCSYKLSCTGKFKAKLSASHKSVDIEVFEVKGLQRPFLSRQSSQSLNLINKIDVINKKDYRTDIVEQYPKLFKGLGEIDWEYEIKLNENCKLFQVTVPRKVPLPTSPIQNQTETDRMLEIGVIRKVDEPTDYPMVVVPRQNGQVKICVDIIKLNANIKREVHPLPSVKFTLDKLRNAKVFSTPEASSVFWQRKLSEEIQAVDHFYQPLGKILFGTITLRYIDRFRTVSESYDGKVSGITRGRMPN